MLPLVVRVSLQSGQESKIGPLRCVLRSDKREAAFQKTCHSGVGARDFRMLAGSGISQVYETLQHIAIRAYVPGACVSATVGYACIGHPAGCNLQTRKRTDQGRF